MRTTIEQTQVVLISDDSILALDEVCSACSAELDDIVALVEEGVLQPQGDAPERWQFPADQLRRARIAVRLHHDLGINPPGAALALQLLEEIEQLRAQLGGRDR